MSIPKRFTGPSLLTNAAVTRYTVPAQRVAVIRHIHLSNPTASPVTFTMSIGADAAGTRIFDAFQIAAGSVFDHFGVYTLVAAEIIQALAGTTNVMTLTIDGEEDLVA